VNIIITDIIYLIIIYSDKIAILNNQERQLLDNNKKMFLIINYDYQVGFTAKSSICLVFIIKQLILDFSNSRV
jgi:hypothetical protein